MRTLFRFNIQSFSDIITNSSSELFVFQKDSVNQVIELLNRIYPAWKNEYNDPCLFKDMSIGKQLDYIDWVVDVPRNLTTFDEDGNVLSFDDALTKFHTNVIKVMHRNWNIKKEEVPLMFSNWDKVEYYDKKPYLFLEFSDKAVELFQSLFEDDICLWSKDENPDYKYQEIIEYFAKRYHLG